MAKDTREDRRSSRPQRMGGPGARIAAGGEKPKNAGAALRRLSRYVRRHTLSLLFVFGLAAIATGLTMVAPLLIARIIDSLTSTTLARMNGETAAVDYRGIAQVLIGLSALFVASSVFRYLQSVLLARTTQTLVYTLRNDVDAKLKKLPLSYYDRHETGDILSRVTNDVDTISNTMQQSLTQLISAVVTLITAVALMFSMDVRLTLLTMLTLPASLLATRAIASRSQKLFKKQSKSLGEVNAHIEENLTGHLVNQAFNRQREVTEQFEEKNERLYKAGAGANFISGLIMPIMNLINNIGFVLVAVVGALFVLQGSMTLGSLQAFISYSRQFTMPIVNMAEVVNVLQSTLASSERVFELLDQPEETETGEYIVPPDTIRGEIGFRHVDFGYDPERRVIRDLSLDAKPGEVIAIVGPTGAGKTTIVNLLMRFYPIQNGEILLDGHDIAAWKSGPYRRLFGMVLQDTWLFEGTIYENIAYGAENPTREEVERAARAAHADHFIRTLPQGYDTVINEEASNVSAGQKQLLTIARAFIADPRILILDEATSSVDTRTEDLIQKGMKELMKGRTNFIIAHRLSTIVGADRILFLRDGDIREQGTHKELLARGGEYAELYNSQFAQTAGESA